MKKKQLYKYYSEERWAEAFLDGNLRFSNLSYFVNYQDENIRGDITEGSSIFRPANGLEVSNLTEGTKFTLKDHSFVSTARLEDVYIFSLSRNLSTTAAEHFKATHCVEVADIAEFLRRVTTVLPADVELPTVGRRCRLGHDVRYYSPEEDQGPRWALPELIAISKNNLFRWQREYRLVFGSKGTFDFENTSLVVTSSLGASTSTQTKEPRFITVETGSLRDICKIRRF